MLKKLKIAVLATVTDFGGAEKVVLSLMKNINSDLFELVPIIFTRSCQLDTKFFMEFDKSVKKYHTIFVDKHKIKYLNPVANIIEAHKLLKQYKFDLVHTHGYRADILGIILSRLTGLPVVSTCHGFISNDLNLKLYNKLDRYLLRYADKIIAVSDGIKNDLIKSGINEKRIAIIQNAVELNGRKKLFSQDRKAKRQHFNIHEKEFVAGYIGRLSEEKGVKYLIEAHTLLAESGALLKMVIIGDGPQRKGLEALVKNTGKEGSIFFAGFQNDIESWLPAMDVFVLPSLTEGTPMSMLEAMAGGIPVVASSVGGVPQVIDSDKSGILVSPGNPEEIKNAIHVLYKNETLRNCFSQEGRKTIELKYDVKHWINKIQIEYLNLIN